MDSCEHFRELAWAQAGELSDEEQAALAAHLESCAACRAEAEGVSAVRDALAPAPEEEGPDAALLARVQRRLTATQEPAPRAEILTPEDVAVMLQVTVDELYENLDLLPAFEFAGRIRFRRRALEAWIEEQEQRWRRQSLGARSMK